jgi:hypothetical protein
MELRRMAQPTITVPSSESGSNALTLTSPPVTPVTAHRNCSPPLAKISDFSGRFEQARQHSGNNGESNREQNEPVEMVRYVKVRKREPRRDFDKGGEQLRRIRHLPARLRPRRSGFLRSHTGIAPSLPGPQYFRASPLPSRSPFIWSSLRHKWGKSCDH